MKKLFYILLVVILTFSNSVNCYASSTHKTPTPTIGNDDITVVFNPSIEKVWYKGGDTIIKVNTTSTAYLYVIQVSNRPDFKGAKSYYRRGKNWGKGCVALWLTDWKDKFKRIFWYDGKIISYREVSLPQKLSVPVSLLKKIEARYAIEKTFTVPVKGKHIRVKCIFYGGGKKIHSKWAEVKVK